MTRWLLILLLAAVPAWAQEGGSAFPPDASGGGGSTYDGGSVTNPFLAPTGCAPTPGYAFTDDAGSGWCRDIPGANTSHQFFFTVSAGPNGLAGNVLDIDRADSGPGLTRTFFRVWDPDATTQAAGFAQFQSSTQTGATSFSLQQYNSNFRAFAAQAVSANNSIEIGDYSTATTKQGYVGIIGGPAGSDTFVRFSPYDGANFFYTDLNVVYPTANRVIALPDDDGSVVLTGIDTDLGLTSSAATATALNFTTTGTAGSSGATFDVNGQIVLDGFGNEVVVVKANGGTRFTFNSASGFYAGSNNAYDLGSTGIGWRKVYAYNALFDGGSVTTPTYSFESDTDTGIFQEAVNEINFTINAEEIIELRRGDYYLLNPDNAGGADQGWSFQSSASAATIFVTPPGETAPDYLAGCNTTAGCGVTLQDLTNGNFFKMLDADNTTGTVRWGDASETDYIDLTAVPTTGTFTVTIPNATGTVLVGGGTNVVTLGSVAFGSLPASANGSLVYCSDCTKGGTPCAGAGTGSIAKREAGAWNCD